VHVYGDIHTNGCTSTGGHYNPFNRTHGAPDAKRRHVGDLGNIEAGADGVAHLDFSDSHITLCGRRTILGRGVVVHDGEDDLGLGGFEDSKTTGHAGNRTACGIM
jgi:Cu-Zn family superoxide dismutase